MDVEEYLKKKEELAQAVKKNGKQIVKDFVSSFFQANPTITAIRWYQYTPYFNDGEACTFSVNDPYVAVKPVEELDFDGYPDDAEGWISHYSSKNVLSKAEQKSFDDFGKAICGKLEDLMLMAFGDHVSVAVMKDEKGKITFRIDEYQHD